MQGGEVREAMSHSSWEGDRLHCGVCRFLKIKTGPETAHLFGCRCPPPAPQSYSRVFPSSSKHIQSNSGQYPIFEKEGRIKRKKKKENPTPALRCPHTQCGRCEGGERRGHGFHVPGHSHPVGGGLPHSAPSHHPAGRILTGKTGAGAEEGAGGG